MSRTVLVIEDNEQNAYLVTFLLEKAGYQVRMAPDGRGGIELAQSFVPHLILLDIQLPTMDGYAVARTLRSFESLRDVPIIAVTSYAMVGDREKSLAAGCTGYIEKPIDPQTFIAEVESYARAPSREDPS
jgi:two-component system cell cycle response regulator DivK